MAGLLAFQYRQVTATARHMALTEARASFNKDLVYRRWATMHGGVYAPVTADTPPNPALAHVPERDITTPSGRALTLVNPAYMTRQVHGIADTQYGVRGHITSLDPIRPENAPDDWERGALEAFERGVPEVWDHAELSGQDHLRLMRPMIAEAGCLKCHAHQGYAVGDIRGGISVSVPWQPYAAIIRQQSSSAAAGHAAVWLVGLAGLGIGARRVYLHRAQRARAQAEHEAVENRYRAFAALASDYLYSFPMGSGPPAPDWVVGRFTETTGYTLQTLGERGGWFAIVHPEDLERLEDARKTLLSGRASVIDYRITTADGRLRWLRDHVQPIVDEHGTTTGVIGGVSDITAEKEAVERLRYQAMLLDQIRETITATDFEGHIIYVNQAQVQVFGHTREELLGQSVARYGSDPVRGATQEEIIEATRSRGGWHGEVVNQAKDGRELLIECDTWLVRDANGRPVGMCGVGRDITAQRRTELERSRLAAELERKNRELQNVLYAASHDLRSPMLNIQGFSQRLSRQCAELDPLFENGSVPATFDPATFGAVREDIRKSLGYIQAGVEKMDRLIEGMLRLSRLGQVALKRETVDMSQLVASVAAELAFQIQTAGAAVRIARLPPCLADRFLLGQVFTNLIDNAIKYRAPDRPLRVEIDATTDGAEIVYRVTDTGPGIPAADLERIWELFQRLDPSATAGEGIGLNLVRRIVERHGGRIWVESEHGRGSRFLVALPVDASPAPLAP